MTRATRGINHMGRALMYGFPAIRLRRSKQIIITRVHADPFWTPSRTNINVPDLIALFAFSFTTSRLRDLSSFFSTPVQRYYD